MRIPVSITTDERTTEVKALVDSGAGGIFIDFSFATRLRLPFDKIPKPIQVYNVDGTLNTKGMITHTTTLSLGIGGTIVETKFFVTGLGKEKIILGLPWLQDNNPEINWSTGSLSLADNTFNQEHLDAPISYLSHSVSKSQINALIRNDPDEITWIRAKTTSSQTLVKTDNKEILISDVIPSYLSDFYDVFEKKAAERFPTSQIFDHEIRLKPTFVPSNCKVYPLSPIEQIELDKFLDENLRKGYIRCSESPMASPFFFVGKKGGALQPCQDYRKLNEGTIKNAYPLPLIPELIDKLRDAHIFTKIDLRQGYNNV